MNRVVVIGCGLIGGSFALALRASGFAGEIVGFGRPETLEAALRRGAIDRGSEDLGEAVAKADLVYLAAPVGAILELLPRLASVVPAGCLITDAGSTKRKICETAAKVLPDGIHFAGGHPLAGRELGGIENADADLFRGAKYVLTATEDAWERPPLDEFVGWIRKMGAEPVALDPASHDRAMAWLSHLPQLLSTGLAAALADEAAENGLPLSLAGPGFRDMVRLASSPYEMWRDICLTNADNIGQALDRVEEEIAHLRKSLASDALEQEFKRARELDSKSETTMKSRGTQRG